VGAEKFETTLSRLESIVEKLEDETVDLDDALKAFEEGVRLSKACMKKLDEAQRKVEILLKESDDLFATEPFAVGDEEDQQ
jgi:exodeoxyribonuclease VII small subunit